MIDDRPRRLSNMRLEGSNADTWRTIVTLGGESVPRGIRYCIEVP